ncbi:MAG: trifunctional transcriptional activator/DNA repair protein Ada/methylated-DNA--[protein]-cysteine S-methyltransferase [Candidatus Rhabdochlamydia sp.]
MSSYHELYYQYFTEKRKEYDGLFFVGVTTTKIVCRPVCPSRKPLQKHCLFYHTVQEALQDGFSPCKRCHPLAYPDASSSLIQNIITAIHKEPHKRWSDHDLKEFSFHPSTARRQFKKRFGMTVIQYARANTMGHAMKSLHHQESVIDTQLSAGYESGSGFRDAFWKIIGSSPDKSRHKIILNAVWLDTPLGPMIALADSHKLYFLDFMNRKELKKEVLQLQSRLEAAITPGENLILDQIQEELFLYFEGKLSHFLTPIHLEGTHFQKTVWEALRQIPYGKTVSYQELALSIQNPKGTRAVAKANSKNHLAIIVPCHRVIYKDQSLGGYAGGISLKKWLLHHENSTFNDPQKKHLHTS